MEILTSLTSDYSSSTSVGVYNPTLSGDANLDESLQVFDLLDTNAQFVRLNIISFDTNILGVAGLAFDVNPVTTQSSVPEPSAIALMGLGIFGLGLSHRKMKK